MAAELVLPVLQTRRFTGSGVAAHDLEDLRAVSDVDRRAARAAAFAAVRNLFGLLGRDPRELCDGAEDQQLRAERHAAFLVARQSNPDLTWSEHLDTWAPSVAEHDDRDWVQDPREGAVNFLIRRVSDGLIRGVVGLTKIRVADRQGDTFYVTCQPSPLFSAPTLTAYRNITEAALLAGLSANFPAEDGPIVGRIAGYTFPLGKLEHLWPEAVYPTLEALPGTVTHAGFLRFVPSPAWPPPQAWALPPLPLTAP